MLYKLLLAGIETELQICILLTSQPHMHTCWSPMQATTIANEAAHLFPPVF